MKRILVFCFFPAFVPPSNGGESRLFNLYKSLSKFHHITLLTSTHLNIQEEKVAHGCNFIERRIPKDSHFVSKWNELTPYSSGGDLSAACITSCGKLPTLLHNAYLEEYADADIIIHDSPFTIDYDLFLEVDKKIRVYNSYNCETLLYKALHPEPKSQPIWDLVRDAEIKLLDGSDAVLYCNKDDLDEFNQLAPNSNFSTIFAPNGMSPLSSNAPQLTNTKLDTIVFIGSGHPPNIEAALKITNEIAPTLPSITFHVIGNCLPKGKYPKNVIRHGFVDDTVKAELISKASLAINPMGMGSGSNVKIFDLFSYAVPVLSTEFGMRGIEATHGQNCLIAPVSDFPKTIELWSSRLKELQQIGKNGKEFATKNYNWDVIAKNVSKQLLEIKRKGGWPEKFILALNDYDSFNNSGGGGVRTRGVYTAINDWCPVVFICFSDSDEITVRYENDKTIVFTIPKKRDHIEAMQRVNSYFHVSADDIVAHRYCMSNEMLVSVYNILKKMCRNIIIEHPYMSSIPISFNDRFVYSSQNNETQIKRDLLQFHPQYKELISDVVGLEKKAVECSSAIIAVSESDADSFVKEVRTSGPVVVVHNGGSDPVPPDKQELATVSDIICSEKSAVFVGSAHMPNIDAVKYIVETLAPACPSVEFHIVGTVCTAFSSKCTTNVHFWGVLSESMKSAVMQSCVLAINPVVTGGGSNIKLADYLSNSLYVVTTPFGLRGYPETVRDHLIVTELNKFGKAIEDSFLKVKSEKTSSCVKRRQFFDENLSMRANAQGVVRLLKNLEKQKKKVLFVTYRYTNPSFGGAESMLGNLIEAMDGTDDFQIDVVSPEVSKINSLNRFSEHYEFDKSLGVNVGYKNVRFARFPLDNNNADIAGFASKAWQAQPLFEREVYFQLKDDIDLDSSGLAWGWGDPEGDSRPARWGYTSCGLHLHKDASVSVKCYSYNPIVIWLKNQHGHLINVYEVNGNFSLNFFAISGTVEITTSVVSHDTGDIRPLAFYVLELLFDNQSADLGKPILVDTIPVKSLSKFQVLDEASEKTRVPLGVNLTETRGPFSSQLDSYLESNIHKYDLVVTHNNVFRPAVTAVTKAITCGVPIISIPHAHLDDDFYHFPDVHQSIINSNLVLASPKVVCSFYEQKGAAVSYLPAGINTKEVFSDDDIAAFRDVCAVEKPFVLVLGRKSKAKGYQDVITAVELLSKDIDIHVVMIGPDDDNWPINSDCVSYLGRQSREVVRGALLSCTALVNMSSSESFGIVLLEAWMAGKPVIVNNACAAFHDLATNNLNALMINDLLSLQEAIRKVMNDPALCKRLAKNGNEILKDYDWKLIGSLFVTSCHELINRSQTIMKEKT
ncbi:MAG: glycosyltransferase involved in cell wall biosynthesis [Roseivirga sp.]|jgi:glycosyltransferase involved in cell wall biosynthesis